MTDSDPRSNATVGRRVLLGGGAATAVSMAAIPAAARPDGPVRAAVMEFADPWTKGTGLAALLRAAGVEVMTLDVTKPPSGQLLGGRRVDLIAFGSFVNNDPAYAAYVGQETEGLRDFAARGGVVLELAQSDQFGASVAYLPEGMSARRADADHDAIYPTDRSHPLVKELRTSNGLLFDGRDTAIRVSWETLVSSLSMRVLMGTSASGLPPCLLEGAHGRGRFLVSSLTVDKVYDAAGTKTIQPELAVADSVAFFTAVARYVGLVRTGAAPVVVPTPVPTEPATGPLVGHVETDQARIWVRPGADHQTVTQWECSVRSSSGAVRVATARLSPANDHTVVFDVRGLRARTAYTYQIRPRRFAGEFAPLTGSFTTAPAPGQPAVVTMGLGSCAPSDPNDVWTRILTEGCDSFVMLGDTPYVDSGDLEVARSKHRAFLKVPQLAELVRSRPIWGTWDDHDFGGNDQHGDFAGKKNTRRAFVDYRANATFGHNAAGERLTTREEGNGVYTSFRRGPIEVFLIDPRWFSRTEPSWADPDQPTCLGSLQWQWLRERLRRSTAPFKALATGMIWDDKQNSEKDDWGTYSYERDAILDFIAAERIPGCFLIGGDIHVSRALDYGPRVGYDLWQFIVSPLHASTIPSLNVPHPALVHSAVEPHVFLKLVADTTVSPATLTATWINRDGRRIFEVRRTATEMGHPA
ncbi:alkaline phosphatase D family protein [Kribbella italica]|uniref:Phosphodiesterase/alkaline phosphatase D-like protein n=1 Tax=Kribbella italica TaxID=1540520 RepID=A0A7W9J4U7_9ACTN|nr:alkaline phosphatase D family protein [Kribbella italica]MBB5835657.1 phosphodiesterase/alkaline phosphatase D-like protein [Kribbella italica]